MSSFIADATRAASVYRPNLFSGKRVLITGASRGIGEFTAREFALLGAEVLLVGNEAEELNGVVDSICANGGKASGFVVDLSERAAVQALADSAGDIDILFNNAAPPTMPGTIMDVPDSHWESMYAVNLFAPLILMRTLARSMIAKRSGIIVNVSSISATTPSGYIAPYASSKAALELLTRVAAIELGPFNIRCNAIAPTLVQTAHVQPLLDNADYMDYTIAGIPLGRIAKPEDIANTVVWLATDNAAFISGQIITVDGAGTRIVPGPPARK